MKNIKFKAKRLDNGEWIEGNLRTSKSGNAMIIPIEYRGAYPVEPTTVCQFTGLTDCEGKELFEHDIIHIVGFNYAAEVIWSECCYAFMVVCENKHSYCLHSVIKSCKIERIGNKFDNKK